MRYQPPEWKHHSTYREWTIEHRPTLQRRGWRIVQGSRKQVFNSLERCKENIDRRIDKPKIGGYRPGAGRKPIMDDAAKRRQITATDEVWQWLKKCGGGNASEGLRRLYTENT